METRKAYGLSGPRGKTRIDEAADDQYQRCGGWSVMATLVTYKSNPSQRFAQLKFADGGRVLISIAQEGVRISRLKWGGLWPAETILDISAVDLFSPRFESVLMRLYEPYETSTE